MVLAGCEAWRGAQIDHPVLGPPPPRLAYVDSEPIDADDPVVTADASGEKAGYVQVSLTETTSIADHDIVAMVNGEPILAGEILAGYQGRIAQFRKQGASEANIDIIKKKAIEKDLDQTIDQVLLAQKMRRTLSADQLKELGPRMDEAFDKRVQTMMEEQGIPSEVELEQFLAARGESLAAYKKHFETVQLAKVYMFEQIGGKAKVFGRPEILEYYQEHQDEFTREARARFQLLEISFKKHGGPEKARARLDEALADLEAGTSFAAVCEQYSDDAQADRGGQWDWLKPGEFANDDVNTAIFSLPIETTSDVIETDSSYVLVRVTERDEAGVAPLTDVQGAILTHLKEQHHQQSIEQLFADLRAEAVITKYLGFGVGD